MTIFAGLPQPGRDAFSVHLTRSAIRPIQGALMEPHKGRLGWRALSFNHRVADRPGESFICSNASAATELGFPRRCKAASRGLCFTQCAARHSFQLVFSNLDRLSVPKAWRPGPAVRRWAGPAAASEHPAMRRPFLLSRGSSFRSADAHQFLPNLCQSFDRCSRAWGQNQRLHGPACEAPTLKTITAQPARMSCFIISLLASILRRVACSAPLEDLRKQRREPQVPLTPLISAQLRKPS